jgi:maltooligosyltrehalose trehalohydrolase
VFRRFAEAYFSDRYENEWGDALNFDGPGAHAVREYFVANAGYWVDEFHFDGLRLDATQSIHDASEEHVIAAIARTARARAGDRTVLLVSENEPQQVRMVRPRDEGGYGLDALWNDDFHHSAVVALTGRNEAYYSDHRGTVQELISAAKYGYLFQGQRYAWQSKPRGTSSIGVPPGTFVNFIENHDQLANSGDGSRLHRRAAVARLRAMTALFVLMPGTPMLFQGQEMAASAPFLYFADHNPSLAVQVKRGRAEFISQFPSLASPEMQARLPAPEDPSTFERCKLDWREATVNAAWVGLHRDLIRLRREHHAFSRQVSGGVDGAAIDRDAFVLRFAADAALEERLLIVNLGADLVRASLPEPLVAPPMGTEWDVAWSSEDPRYGGGGTPCVVGKKGWSIPACSAVVLAPERADGSTRRK